MREGYHGNEQNIHLFLQVLMGYQLRRETFVLHFFKLVKSESNLSEKDSREHQYSTLSEHLQNSAWQVSL